jgi:deoxyinosine 3'endonuclease (endonuclease V)
MSQRPDLIPGVTARYGAVDVHYPENGGACAALVVAHDPTFATVAEEKARRLAARPLYVTAAGIPVGEAAALVTRMAGDYRIPDALRRVDKLARTAVVLLICERPSG